MIVDLEGLTGVAAFINHAFWWIVAYGALSFGFASVLLVYDRVFRPWAAVPALCASVTFTMLASFATLCAVLIPDRGSYLYAYALACWIIAIMSARLCTKAIR